MTASSRTHSPALRLTDDQRRDWLRLIRCEGVGPRTFRGLVNQFGGAAAALAALPDLAKSRGRGLRVPTVADAERELEVARRMGVRFVATGEADYPPQLAAIDTAPPLIALRGSGEVSRRPCVAIVGSRNASASGLVMAKRLASDLADAGFAIVSGLARGIDASAHRASLHRGTVAVLAGGHDRIYPAEHESLIAPILETGAVIAEMPMGWEPRGRDFPRRNRIVSGLALGVVLIEAARKSGSLITARFALEQGREVFAVPGSPLDPRCEGTNGLIRQGATLATCAQDVIEVLQPLIESGEPMANSAHGSMGEDGPVDQDDPLWDELDLFGLESDFSASSGSGREGDRAQTYAAGDGEIESETMPRSPRGAVVALLGPSPSPVDEIVRASLLGARAVNVVLFELEQEGLLERHGAGLVSLRPPG